jgi:hypothetical protein
MTVSDSSWLNRPIRKKLLVKLFETIQRTEFVKQQCRA